MAGIGDAWESGIPRSTKGGDRRGPAVAVEGKRRRLCSGRARTRGCVLTRRLGRDANPDAREERMKSLGTSGGRSLIRSCMLAAYPGTGPDVAQTGAASRGYGDGTVRAPPEELSAESFMKPRSGLD